MRSNAELAESLSGGGDGLLETAALIGDLDHRMRIEAHDWAAAMLPTW
jgi:hypothetical protein